jgi:predicted negative regulator of RcsB-dependent stress response
MLKKIEDFLLLFFIIIKLFINLASFSVQYLILRVKERRELTLLLLMVFLVLSLINWQLWQKHKTPKTELKTAPSQNPGEILLTLEKEELNQLKNFYLTLESKQKYSRDILFNLGKILELEDSALAQEKFQQALELDPNYSSQ